MNAPNDSVRAELKLLLERDQRKMGQVYRLTERGLDAKQIAKELGVGTSGFVSNKRTSAKALLDGFIPGGASIAKEAMSDVRHCVGAAELSREARTYLDDLLGRLEDLVESGKVGRRTKSPPANSPSDRGSLRSQVEDELRERAWALVVTIKRETDIDADDYVRIRTSQSPMDELAEMVLRQGAGRTFLALSNIERLDLSLEGQIVDWARDLPLPRDVVEAARARRKYYEHHEGDPQ